MLTAAPHRDLARAMLLATAAAVLGLGSGCAALGGGGGGGEELPNRGVVPWVPLPIADGTGEMSPFVLVPGDGEELREPFVDVTDEGIALYYERTLADGSSVIERATSADGLVFGEPGRLLAPGDAPAWAGGRVGAPSLTELDNTWLLAFEYGDGAGIGLAWSFDGAHFEVDTEPLLTRTGAEESGGVGSPSLIAMPDGTYELYYTATTGGDAPTRSVLRATAGGDLVFERAGVVIGPGVGCTEPDGQPEPCWDADGAAHPEVRVAYTPAGRLVRRLFYTGDGPGREQLGFAASYDGEFWSRYAFNPVLSSNQRLRAPTSLDRGDHYLLYYVDRRSSAVQGIGVAYNDDGHTSERF